jgi:uncharacterized protein YjbI with pentapeptide repeats
MANREHLAILQQGVEAWSRWRNEHRDIHPDLSRIDATDADLRDVRLSFTQLQGACFRGAHLQRAYFVNSDLSNADFRHAHLAEAHLDGANLKGADLSGARLNQAKIRTAHLQGANLSGADLSFAQLDRTNFSHANLYETNFHGATIRFAEFFDVDFRTAQGLETVVHHGPSHLGIQTLVRSLEHLPAAFLQGARVSDALYAYAYSLGQKPIVYLTCFLSYASADQHIAEQIQNDLHAHDVFCWSTSYDSASEDESVWRDEPIFIYDVLLLVISEHSTTQASHRALNRMVKEALSKERQGVMPVLIPLYLEKDPPKMQGVWPRLLRVANVQGRDFSCWNDQHAYQEVLHQLLRDLMIS